MIDDVRKLGAEIKSLMDSYFLCADDFTSSVSRIKRDALERAFVELMELYSTDKNSSTLREFITLKVAGFTATGGKLGFNGYKGTLKAEVKPKNVTFEIKKDTDGKEMTYKVSGKDFKKGDSMYLHRGKLNGGGNFTDFTQDRLDKHIDTEKTVMMLISGFVEGKLAYVIEFPFEHPDFKRVIKNAVEGFYGEKGSKREPGKFKRSIEFNYTAYKSCPTLRAVWVNKKLILNSKVLFNKDFLEYLNGLKWEIIVGDV